MAAARLMPPGAEMNHPTEPFPALTQRICSTFNSCFQPLLWAGSLQRQ